MQNVKEQATSRTTRTSTRSGIHSKAAVATCGVLALTYAYLYFLSPLNRPSISSLGQHCSSMFTPITALLASGLYSLASSTIIPARTIGNATWPYQTFNTVDFTPPVLKATHHVPLDPEEGYLFIAPDGPKAFQTAPLIVDANGNLIWNGPDSHAFNFGVYTYRNEQVLAYWNGTLFSEPVGRGNGQIHILNNHYEEIAVVKLPGNFLELTLGASYESNVDLHELYITEKDTILVTANNVTLTDLTSVGGPKEGWITDCLVYELDIATNEILFQWSSLEHRDALPLNASVYPLGSEGYDGTTQENAWGYFHINAVSPFNGGYILSSRFFCAAVQISRSSGDVEWILQGQHGGDFELLDERAGFCYQHDVRAEFTGQGKRKVAISLHDNSNSPVENGSVPSSGKILDVDLQARTVGLRQEYRDPRDEIFSTAQGNLQRLPGGKVFVGHGWIPVAEEFAADGAVLSTYQFGAPRELEEVPTLGYRDFRHVWVGCPPADELSVVAERCGGDGMKVFVSWNGATDVVGWEVFTGDGRVWTVSKEGFETVFEVLVAERFQVRPVFEGRYCSSRHGWVGRYWGRSGKPDGCRCEYEEDVVSQVVVVGE